MPVFDCSITDDDIGGPGADDISQVVNPDYEEPLKQPRAWISIQVFAGDEVMEFGRHYISNTYEDEYVFGGRSSCSFGVDDNNGRKFNLPGRIIKDLKVIVEDLTNSRRLFYGFVVDAPKKIYGPPRPDGSYMGTIQVECQDAWRLMEARTYSFDYKGWKAGAILKDAADRGGLDSTLIDPEMGPTFGDFSHNEAPPSQAWERVMVEMDYTYYLDIQYDPPRIIPCSKDSEQARVDLNISASTWSKIFSELEINPAQDDYANEVVLVYKRRFGDGGANFQTGSDIVVGYTGNEGWYAVTVKDAPTIENLLTGKVYTIKGNNSTATGINELELSTNYAEDDTGGAGTNVPYLIRGVTTKIRRRNSTEVARRLALNPADKNRGIVTKVIVRDDAAYTYGEASVICSFELALYSRQYFRGHGVIATSWNADWALFMAGKTLYFDLIRSHEVAGFVRIESLKRKAIGGAYASPLGHKSEGMQVELGFTPAIYYDREQVRAILWALRKNASVGADQLTESIMFDNILAIKACAHVVLPLKERDPSIIESETLTRVLLPPTFIAHTDRDYTCYPGYISMTGG